jgi:nitroreductase
LVHQARKRAVNATASVELSLAPVRLRRGHGEFWAVFDARRSVRLFAPGEILEGDWETIVDAARIAPSSCNRGAVSVGLVTRASSIERLSQLLVGAAIWGKHAAGVLLFFADPAAYKSPAERDFMPWLDVGAACMSASLAVTRIGLGGCWVNPNVRPVDRDAFGAEFNPRGLILGSALFVGVAAEDPDAPARKTLDEMFEYRLD